MKLYLFLSLLTTLGISLDSSQNFKNLNTINLLLPQIHSQLLYNGASPQIPRISYNLVAQHSSCYEWSSTNPDSLMVSGKEKDVQVQCIDKKYVNEEKCWSEAVVMVNSLAPVGKVIWITAKEKKTGEISKVEAKISRLHRIQIVTRLRSIDVGDNQVISIQGVDEYGNVFTSLEGVQFQWEIRQNENGIMKQILFSDASVQTSELRSAMEKNNIFSDMIVVRGLKTGTVEIYARVKEEGYGVIEDSIKMKVIEHFFLFPEEEIYILPTTQVQFDLALVKTEKNAIELEQIDLPNDHYLWKLNETDKGKIESNGVFTAEKTPGDVQLQVSDKRIDDNILSNIIHIVEPQLIKLQIKEYEGQIIVQLNFKGNEWDQSLILPKFYTSQENIHFTNNWNLVKDRQYYVRAFLYDYKYNPIQITKNIHIEFEHDSQVIEIIEQKNHELLIKAKKLITKCVLKGQLQKIVNEISYKPKQKIETEQLLSIYSQVKIINNHLIHLPYLGGSKNQVYQLRTLGGSGGYDYKIENYTVGEIDSNGLVVGKEIGQSVILVQDLKNERNRDRIEVEVSVVREITFPDFYKEMLVRSKSELFVIGLGVVGANGEREGIIQQYSNCSEVMFRLEEEEERLIKGREFKEVRKDVGKNLKGSLFFKESLEKWRRGFEIKDYQEYIINKEISQQKLEEIFNEYQNYGICGEIALYSQEAPGQLNSKVRATNINHPTAINSEQITVKIYKNFNRIAPRIESKEFLEGVEVIMAYGSSVVWQLDGGPQYWEEQREMKVEKEVVSLLEEQEDVELIIEEQETARFHQLEKQFFIACPNPSPSLKSLTNEQTFLFKLSMQNTPDILLHTTLNLSTQIKISCKIPKVLQITPLTVTSVPLDVNTAKVITQQTLHLSNTEPHYFQVYAYDSKNQPFYNFSSLLIQWEIRQDRRLTLPSQQSQLEYLKLAKLTQQEFQQFPFHAQYKLINYLDQLTKLQFLDEISNISPLAFLIHASTTTYEPIYTQLKFMESWDQLPITAINPVSLTPARQSLFFHGSNTAFINVHHGSGKFDFYLNNSSIANFNYFEHNQTVVISPFKLGVVKLVANDKLVQSTKTVSSIVEICYAQGIQLHSTLRIFQEGNYCEVSVLLIDQRGRMIPEDQYQFIEFELQAKGVENNQRYFVFERQGNGKFIVNGFVAGEYLIYAVTPHLGAVDSTEWLKSNYLEIIVFPRLYSNPTEIIISPECITNVVLLGGPTEKQKNMFQIETNAVKNSQEGYEIQQVKAEELFFRIRATKPNESQQEFVLVHSETKQVLAQYLLKIKIGFVTDIEIHNMKNRNIYQGATFRLLALFSIKNQQLTPSICPFDIHWKSYQEQIISVSVPDFKSAFERTKFLISDDITPVQYLLGTNASAIGLGNCELELKVSFNYKTFPSSVMTSLQTINILEPHQTQNTLFINKENRLTSYLILPKNTQYQLNPNRAINLERFNMECTNNLASVSQTGVITTYNLDGRASINLEDPSIKNDYATVDLFVSEIHSLLIESSYKVISIPIGSESNLQIFALDSFGRVFPAGIKGVSYDVFIQDQQVIAGKITHFPGCEAYSNIECANDKNNNNFIKHQQRPILTLRGLSPGLSIVRITLKTDNNLNEIFDQFTVIVGSIISPVSPVKVHLGAEVQFTAQVQKQLSNEENQELWFSGDEKICRINSRNGKMVAKGEGQTSIEYKDIVRYLTKVKVCKVDEIMMNNAETDCKVMTNIQSSKEFKNEYKIAFKLLAKNQEINYLKADESLPNINNNLKFSCRTNAEEWLATQTEVQSNSFKQIPYCVVKPKKNLPANTKIPSELIISTELESINKEVQYRFVQEFKWELFDWAFVPEKNFIQLDKNNRKIQLKIFTTHELDIICFNEQIRTKLSPKYMENENLLTLNIDLSQQKSDLKTKIQLRNQQTNQTEIIHIHYFQDGYTGTLSGDAQSNSTIETILNLLLLAIIIILCFTLYRYWESKKNEAQIQGQPKNKWKFGQNNINAFKKNN